jgi:hypothetical protein
MRYPMTILLGLAGVYVLVCLLVIVFQHKFVYFPERQIVATPADVDLLFDDVFFKTDDAVALHGWYVPVDGARHVLIFFHGNAGNISHCMESIALFHGLGVGVFVFDYRGFGRSGGRAGEAGTYKDAQAALSYVRSKLPFAPENVIYFGRSLGSAVAIELATHEPPKGLIAESCFSSMPDVGARVYPWLPVRLMSRIRYDSMPRVAALSCPKLFIHSQSDEILPFALARRLFDAAAEPKAFIEIGGDHNTGFVTSGAVYVDALVDFFESLR